MNVVSTLLKDTPANVRRFVEGNLSHGVDHLLVLLDEPDAEVEAYLARHPHVTHAVLDDRFWAGRRNEHLNQRQRVAANLARVAVIVWGGVDWLIFLDSDEIALLDQDVIDGIDPDVQSFVLRPLESLVGGEADEFKRLLRRPKLQRLVERGALEQPTNRHLFRGHLVGKVGLRPRWELRAGVHHGVDVDLQKVAVYEHPQLRHLHFESVTYEEFVRKMTNLVVGNGQGPVMRSQRQEIADLFREASASADPAVRETRLRALYEDAIVDDADTLRKMRAVVRVDVTGGTWVPRSPGRERLARLDSLVDALLSVDPDLFGYSTPVDELRRSVLGFVGQGASGDGGGGDP